MNRRAVGWFLLLGWPGLASGITVSAMLLLGTRYDTFALLGWLAAAAGAGVGGHMVASRRSQQELRAVAMVSGFAIGAAVYFFTVTIFETAWMAMTL